MSTTESNTRTMAGPASVKTRYVFAASKSDEHEQETKVCPRCGQLLFADMDVCYGCLYDFSRDRHVRDQKSTQSLPAAQRMVSPAKPRMQYIPHDPLASVELDEIDEEVEGVDSSSQPRHRREVSSAADDTADLSELAGSGSFSPLGLTEVFSSKRDEMCVQVTSRDMQTRVAIPQDGLIVGRDPSCDLVLFGRAVSRRHLRLLHKGTTIRAEDLGATNAATVGGVPLKGSVELKAGEVVEVCGVRIEACDHPSPRDDMTSTLA